MGKLVHMGSLIRYLVGRRLAALLPGGWLVLLLTSAGSRRMLMRGFRRGRRGVQARRARRRS